MSYLTSAGQFFVAGQLRPEVEKLWRRFYPAYSDRAIAERIEGLARPEMDVLELRAWSGDGLQNRFPLKELSMCLIGFDLDPRVTSNTCLDEAHFADVCELACRAFPAGGSRTAALSSGEAAAGIRVGGAGVKGMVCSSDSGQI